MATDTLLVETEAYRWRTLPHRILRRLAHYRLACQTSRLHRVPQYAWFGRRETSSRVLTLRSTLAVARLLVLQVPAVCKTELSRLLLLLVLPLQILREALPVTHNRFFVEHPVSCTSHLLLALAILALLRDFTARPPPLLRWPAHLRAV